MKYGKGAIRVVVEQAGRAIDITVEDEGPGFPTGFSPARTSGLGMRIVSALSKAGKSAIRVDRTVSHGRITARLLLDDALPAEQAANTPAA
jgi:two-component sensor histidine kinase